MKKGILLLILLSISVALFGFGFKDFVGGMNDLYSKPSKVVVQYYNQRNNIIPQLPGVQYSPLPFQTYTPDLLNLMEKSGLSKEDLADWGFEATDKNGITFVGVNPKKYFDESIKGVDFFRSLTQGDGATKVLGDYADGYGMVDDAMDAVGVFNDVLVKNEKIQKAKLSSGRSRAMKGVVAGVTAYKTITRVGLKLTKLGDVPIAGSFIKDFLDGCADSIFGGFMAWAKRHQRVDNCIEDPLNCDLGGGRPGADTPDDNDNVGPGVAFTGNGERNLYIRALQKGYTHMIALKAYQDAMVENSSYQFEEMDPVSRGIMLDMLVDLEEMEMPADANFSKSEWEANKKIIGEIVLQMATAPEVAVLSAGYVNGVLSMLSQFGEPATLVRGDTPIEQLERFSLLIIPSGGLADWHLSKTFKKTIEVFAASGGKVLVMAQQLGKEYKAIPGNIEAYGWVEDQSCQYSSSKVMIENSAFASIEKENPDFNVDGYFLSYPVNSEIWLLRSKNEQPCMLSFPYGNGEIVLSSLYLDWAAANHQGTNDERIFFRDLVSSLIPEIMLPVVWPGESFSFDISVFNSSFSENITVQPFLIDPDGKEIKLDKIDAFVAPLDGKVMKTSIPKLSKTGVYQSGSYVVTEKGYAINDYYYGQTFVYSKQAQTSEIAKDLKFSVQSDLEKYVIGATGKFTVKVWNYSEHKRTIRVDYRFPHNSWSAENPEDYKGEQILEIPAGEDRQFDLEIKVVNTDGIDRLWANFIDNETGENLKTESKGFYTIDPQVEVNVFTDSESYSSGEKIIVDVDFINPTERQGTFGLDFLMVDNAGQNIRTISFDSEMAEKENTFNGRIPIASDVVSGELALQAFLKIGGGIVGIGQKTIEYVGPSLSYSGTINDRFTGEPLPNAEVLFYFGSQKFKGVTDSSGNFIVSLPAASYQVAVTKNGYNQLTKKIIVYPQDNKPFKAKLIPSGKGFNLGEIHGTVYDRTTQDILSNVELIFTGNGETFSVMSDYLGQYSLSLVPGNYSLMVHKDGIKTSNDFTVKVIEGYSETFDVYAVMGKVKITVKDHLTERVLKDFKAEMYIPGKNQRIDVSTAISEGWAIHLPGAWRWAIEIEKKGYQKLKTELFVNEILSESVFYLYEINQPFTLSVYDYLDDTPLKNVKVSVLKLDKSPAKNGTTDFSGTFSGELPAGRYLLELESSEYQKLSTEFYVYSGGENTEDHYLRKSEYDYSMRIMDIRDESPVSHATILLNRANGSDVRNHVTDDSGILNVSLSEGRWIMKVQSGDYSNLETELYVTPRNERLNNYYLYPDSKKPQGRIAIRVLDYLSEKPLNNVRVYMKNQITGYEKSGSTDASGILEMEMLDGRTYIKLERDGYEGCDTEIIYSSLDNSVEAFYMIPKTVNYPIEIRDIQSGMPISGVEIYTGSDDNKNLVGTTDINGKAFLLLTRGRNTLTFESSGFRTETTDFYVTGTSAGISQKDNLVYLTVERSDYTGRIADSSGNGITGVSVTLTGPNNDLVKTISGSDGSFTAALKYGKYNVLFEKDGYRKHDTQIFFGLHENSPETFYMYGSEEDIPGDNGTYTIMVYDAVTGRSINKFRANPLNTSWLDTTTGQISVSVPYGNKWTNITAEGYYESGVFYTTGYGNKSVLREIYLWPVHGEYKVNVRDIFTGEPIETSTILLNTGSQIATGEITAVNKYGNQYTSIKADGYYESGVFYPTCYPGKSIEREIFLWPRNGDLTFQVYDAITRKPISEIKGYLLNQAWKDFTKGNVYVSGPFINNYTIIRADGYYESGIFYPRAFPGKAVTRKVYLWPIAGKMVTHVFDVITGKPIDTFSGYILGMNWKNSEYGELVTEKETKNDYTTIKADGYYDVGIFYPTAFGGKTVIRDYYLWPVNGEYNITIHDSITKEILEGSAYLLNNNWQNSENGTVSVSVPAGNKYTVIKADNHYETGAFYPSSYPGKTISRTCFLWPRNGDYKIKVYDALNKKPLNGFQGYILNTPWKTAENGELIVSVESGSKYSNAKLDGFFESGVFYPTSFSGRTVEQEIYLLSKNPAGRVKVHVDDIATGEAISGASVIADYDAPIVTNQNGDVYIDKNEHFKVIWLRVQADGYKEQRIPCFVITGIKSLEISVPLEEIPGEGEGGLVVNVKDSSNNYLSEAEISLGSGDKVMNTRTDNGGSATFKDIKAGTYSIFIQKNGYMNYSGKVKIEGDNLTYLNPVLRNLKGKKDLVPFNLIVLERPGDMEISAGEILNVEFMVQNTGELSGKLNCELNIPGIKRTNKSFLLGSGDKRKILFEVEIPEDSVGGNYSYELRIGNEILKKDLIIVARNFAIKVKPDKLLYENDEEITLNVGIELPENTEKIPLSLRINFNEYSDTINFVLDGESTEFTVSGIPASFTGNKLLYGLYYPSGRSINLNAIYIYEKKEKSLILDKQQYLPGEKGTITIYGPQNDSLTVLCELFGEAQITTAPDGKGVLDFIVPEEIPTNSYELLVGDEVAGRIDVRGKEITIRDSDITLPDEEGRLRVSWKSVNSEDMECIWIAEKNTESGTYQFDHGKILVHKGNSISEIKPYDDGIKADEYRIKLYIQSPIGEKMIAIIYFNLR